MGKVAERSIIEPISAKLFEASAPSDKVVFERVAQVEAKHGIPRSGIALSGLLQKEALTTPIIGTTRVSHAENAVAAPSIKLTHEEIAALEETYVPGTVIGIRV